MSSDLIRDDRGRGPEITGTRITVYNLLPHFLDEAATEEYICRLYGLTPEQVAAARAYVLHNVDQVLSEHLRIEARIAAGNAAEVIEEAKHTHANFWRFKKWLSEREQAIAHENADESTSRNVASSSLQFPTFTEWLAQQQPRTPQGS